MPRQTTDGKRIISSLDDPINSMVIRVLPNSLSLYWRARTAICYGVSLQSNAIINEREAKQKAERAARPRTEFVELEAA